MSKYVTNDELIILILAGTIVGSFITKNTDLLQAVVTGLIGFMGGKAIEKAKI